MYGEVNARRVAPRGILSIAVYMRPRLDQWWSVEWRQRSTLPNDPWYYKRPRPEIHTGEHGKSKSSTQPPACRQILGEYHGSPA